MSFLGKERWGVSGLGSSACKIPNRFPSESAFELHLPRQIPYYYELRRQLESAELALAASGYGGAPAVRPSSLSGYGGAPAVRPSSLSGYGGAPAVRPSSLSGYGGGLDRCLVKVPGSTPDKIPKLCSDLGRMMKPMVRYEAEASDPTAVHQTVERGVPHLRPPEEPRNLPDRVPPAERENEKTRRTEDLKQINVRSTPEGNYKFPPPGLSVVVTGWGEDPLLPPTSVFPNPDPSSDRANSSYETLAQGPIFDSPELDGGKPLVEDAAQKKEKVLRAPTVNADLSSFINMKLEQIEQTWVKAKSCTGDGLNADRKLHQKLEMTEDEAHFHMMQGTFLYNFDARMLTKSYHCFSRRLMLEYSKFSSLDSDEPFACKLNNPKHRDTYKQVYVHILNYAANLWEKLPKFSMQIVGLLWILPPWPDLNFCEVNWMVNGREKGAGTAAKKDSYNAVTGQSKIYFQQDKSKPFIEAGVKNETVSAASGTPSTDLIASGNNTPQRCFSPMKSGTGTFEDQNNSPGVATPPPEFCCPIFMKLMSDPVIIASGHTCERENIDRWLNEEYDSYPRIQETVEVKLVQVRDLTNKDLNPIGNEHFESIVEDPDTHSVSVKIYDDDGIQGSELIGCVQVVLNDLQKGKVKDVWLNLVQDLEIPRDRKNWDQEHLELLYCPFDMKDEAMNNYGKNFGQISSWVKIRSYEQCKVFFSKAGKSLGLDLILQGTVDVGLPTSNTNGGRSDTDEAYTAERDVCPVAEGAVQGNALSVVTFKQPKVDGSNGPDVIDVKVEEGEIKTDKTTHQASCVPIDINCPESTEDPQNSDAVNQMNMHGNSAMASSTEQAVAAHLEIRSNLHFVVVIQSSKASKEVCITVSRMERTSHHNPENALGGVYGILDQKRRHVFMVRLKVNISSPHFEWQRKSGGGFHIDRISHILLKGCLVVKFAGNFSIGEVCSCLADSYEVEVVSFDKCEGIVKKYEHFEVFHWAVRPLLIAMGLFTAMRLDIFRWEEADTMAKCLADGNLFTAAAYDAHPEFISLFVKALGGSIAGLNKRIWFLSEKYFLAGVVDGLNSWADDLVAFVGKNKLVRSTYYSLMHTVVDLVKETGMIHGYGFVSKMDEAVKLFDGMVLTGWKPNAFIYGTLLDGYCKEGRTEDATTLFKEMLGKGINPGAITYIIMLDCLFKTWRTAVAKEFLKCLKVVYKLQLPEEVGIYPVFNVSRLKIHCGSKANSSLDLSLESKDSKLKAEPNSVLENSVVTQWLLPWKICP